MKEFDKTVVFPARSGRILPAFSEALFVGVPSKAKTPVLACYRSFISEFGESTVMLRVTDPQVLLMGSLITLSSQSDGRN